MSALSARTQANRLNAEHSTGPTSEEGKAASSRNAIKHGLFCKDLLLDGDDPAEFAALKDGLLRRLNPRDAMELRVCDQIIAAHWKLLRIRSAEKEAYIDQAQVLKAEVTQFRSARDPNPRSDRVVPEPCSGRVLWRMLEDASDSTIERLGRYETRINNTLHRLSKQLEAMQQQEITGQLSEIADEALRDQEQMQNEANAANEANANVQNEANAATDGDKRQAIQQMYRTLGEYRRCADLQKDMYQALLKAPLPTLKPAQTVDELLEETLAALPERIESQEPPKSAA